MSKTKLYLPFFRAAIAICKYSDKDSEILETLSAFNLPKDPKVIEITKPHLEESTQPKYVSFVEYIKTLKANPTLTAAIEYNKNPYVSHAIKAATLLNINPKEIVGFPIQNDVLEEFKNYFFDTSHTDLISWQVYLEMLPKYDQDLLRNAQAGNKDLVFVTLGKLPTDMSLLVNDLVVTAFKKFKESIEDNPRVARIWARIATDALVNSGDKGLDMDSKPFELIFQNYEISDNPEEKVKIAGQTPMIDVGSVSIKEKKDEDEIASVVSETIKAEK